MKYIYFAGFIIALSWTSYSSAQEATAQKGEVIRLSTATIFDKNFTSFSPDKDLRDIDIEVLNMNKGFEHHPELGNLYKTPCKDCYELLAKRTATSRTYAKKGSKGTHIFLMNSTEPMHYQDDKGKWLTLSREITKDEEGIYTLKSPYTPVSVNTTEGWVSMGKDKNQVRLNSDLQLLFVDNYNREHNLGKVNWANYTAGSDGIRITDAWPGIDMTMEVSQGKVKTDYIIKSPLPQYSSGTLIIRDKMAFSGSCSIQDVFDHPFTRFHIVSGGTDTLYNIGQAIAFFANDIVGTTVTLPYVKNGAGILDIRIKGSYLNRPDNAYPFVIDPLFSAQNALAAYTMGTKNGGFTDPCSYTNNAPVPPAVTITDLRVDFGYQINFILYNNVYATDVGFRIRLDKPGGESCALPILTSAKDSGVGGRVNQVYLADRDRTSIHSFLKDCYPPPQCASYNLPVVLDFYRKTGPVAACGDISVAYNYLPFLVIIEGRTLELEYLNSSDSSRTIYHCRGDSLKLTPGPVYGVPPYKYLWTPSGATTSTLYVSPQQDTTYHVEITDQCGNKVADSIRIILKEPSATTVEETICNAALPYVWNGISITSSGTYKYVTPNHVQCDSVVTLHLHLEPVNTDTLRVMDCNSTYYRGKTYTSSTSFVDTFRLPNGCDTLRRLVDIEIKGTRLWVPNAFSPNGDTYNDEFGATLVEGNISTYSLKIFNRWGTPVFASYNIDSKWDGMVGGHAADIGTYFYFITGKCNDNTPIELKGTLDLIR